MVLEGEQDPRTLIDISYFEKPEEEEATIREALQFLVTEGFRAEAFNRDSIQALYISVPNYLKEVRNITSVSDSTLLGRILQAAICAKKMSLPRHVDPKGLLNVARWAKGSAGAKVIADVQYALKLERRATPGATQQEISLANILDLQMQQMSALVKEERSKREATIARWHKKIAKQRERMAKNIKAIKAAHVPSSAFVPLDKEKVSRLCWDKFTSDLTSKGAAIPKWNVTLAIKVEQEFGSFVTAEHRQAFVRQTGVGEQLAAFCKRKIAELEKWKLLD